MSMQYAHINTENEQEKGREDKNSNGFLSLVKLSGYVCVVCIMYVMHFIKNEEYG